MPLTARSIVLALLTGLLTPGAGGVLAQTAPVAQGEAAALAGTLQIPDVLAVMREEGLVYGDEMATEMFGGPGGAGWRAEVSRIYDVAAMQRRFEAAFAAALAGAPELAEIEAFFGSDLGQRLLSLEVAARRALLDPTVEEAAKLAFADMTDRDDPRVAALRAFAEANDLIESNVMGALNANLAFYQGLSEAANASEVLPEDQMLAEVWAQEPQVRADAEDWLFPYLALAYRPLTDDELASYLAFSETPAGQVLNAALFAAFDDIFIGISRDLGRAAARQMQGEDL